MEPQPISPYLHESKIAEMLIRAVEIPSISGDEMKLAAYIQECLQQAEIEAEIDRHGNVVAVWDAGPGPTLVLNTHMDTVPADGSWTHPPFSATRIGNRLYGLGTADTKASLVAMVCAVSALRELGVRLRGKVIFTAVVQEEVPKVDSKGTVLCIRDGLKADFGICGEPTELEVGLGCEGTLEVEVRTHGRSAHACDPAKGINAVDHMMRFLGDAIKIPTAEHQLFGRGSINVGRIEGGIKGTMVPALCRARVGRFVVPGEDIAHFVSELESIACALKQQYPAFRVEIDPIYASSAAAIEPWHSVVRAVAVAAEAALSTPPPMIGVKYHADSDFLINLAKIPTVIFGPGSIDQGHSPDEFVEMKQVVSSAVVYARTIQELLGCWQ
jgi:acetylornithine deacetylase/succinyl-diaminopimelate desuccinylase-like protein